MKLIHLSIVVFLAISSICFAQASFSDYNALGDGITDDRDAIQRALNAEQQIKAEPNKIFYVSSRLHLNQDFEHNIDWNGAIIISDEPIYKLFQIQKMTTGARTTMKNLTIEGNNVMHTATYISSPTTFINVDIKNLVQGDSPAVPLGINVQITDSPNSFGDYLFDGCDITNITATDDGDIGNSIGGAYPVYIQWKTVPTTPTTVTIQNATYDGSWGEDGCLIYVYQLNDNEDIGSTLNHNYFKNLTLKNWQRRAVKGFCGGQTWENSTFFNTPDNHPKITDNSSDTAGLLAIGASNSNFTFKDCTFVDVEPNETGRDNRLIFSNATNAKVENCTFEKGARVAFARDVGDILFCGNSFGEGSYAYDYLEAEDFGEITFDANNSYAEPNFFDGINFFSYEKSDLTCNQINYEASFLKVFPNPSRNFIELLLPKSIVDKHITYTIYNSVGQKIIRNSLNESNNISVTELSSGIYYIQVQSSEKVFQSKFIKL